MGYEKIPVLVSACLLGRKVRYDGELRQEGLLVDTLKPWVEFVEVCPEVEFGFSVPRDPLVLVQKGRQVRILRQTDSKDFTKEMLQFFSRRVEEFARLDPCGAILKSRSPSCAIWDARLRTDTGLKRHAGLFAQTLMRALPYVPVIDERTFARQRQREAWVAAVCTLWKLTRLQKQGASPGEALRRFNLEFWLRGLRDRQELSQVIRLDGAGAWSELKQKLPNLLARPVAPAKQARFLKNLINTCEGLDPKTKSTLLALVAQYARGLVPRFVPVLAIKSAFEQVGHNDLLEDAFLNLHPLESHLRWRY